MKTLLNYIKESLLLEGGHAVTAEPIPAYIAPFVYQEIEEKIKAWKKSVKLAPLGSLGKKFDDQFTGDIDIAIDLGNKYEGSRAEIENLNRQDIVSMMKELWPNVEISERTTNKIASMGYPYNINGKSGIAQIDFMFTDNLDWAKWRFSSPDLKNGESKYKAAPKVYLLMYIVSSIPVKDAQDEYFEDGVTVKRRWRYCFNQEGVFKQLEDYTGKNGKPKKTATKLKEFEELVTADPMNVMRFIFSKQDIDTKIFNSVESLWDAIHSDLWPWGKEALGKAEERWYKEYINGQGMKECPVDPDDFKLEIYKPEEQ